MGKDAKISIRPRRQNKRQRAIREARHTLFRFFSDANYVIGHPGDTLGTYSYELETSVVGNAPPYCANPALPDEEKLRALRLMAGYGWSTKATKKVFLHKLLGSAQRAVGHPYAKRLESEIRSRLQAVWLSPPLAIPENPHE